MIRLPIGQRAEAGGRLKVVAVRVAMNELFLFIPFLMTQPFKR